MAQSITQNSHSFSLTSATLRFVDCELNSLEAQILSRETFFHTFFDFLLLKRSLVENTRTTSNSKLFEIFQIFYILYILLEMSQIYKIILYLIPPNSNSYVIDYEGALKVR